MSDVDDSVERALQAAWSMGGLEALELLAHELLSDDPVQEHVRQIVAVVQNDPRRRRSEINDRVQAVLAETMTAYAVPGMSVSQVQVIRKVASEAVARMLKSLGLLACDVRLASIGRDRCSLAVHFDDAKLDEVVRSIRDGSYAFASDALGARHNRGHEDSGEEG